ncbi:ParB N-terminal domain-containing protein [Jiangella alkaliphila]|uniref:Chromosome partitioning protein, ParB family n=1 Tax=Jiangella alkaliphila TaxID=419479 RepID=A0A1H2L8F7_9ACTN|nr:ParB N-terminal domain-containing protein [Jiangella alkaliphila]SDU77124.1 chromosome partitioning protein, ParB family [Jiangella alkaliphila]
MGSGGHIELDRAIDSIRIGLRHRTDLGDIDALAASIERIGLVQPPTITPDSVLVCGRRRLAAMQQLGWRTTPVWVRSGISDQLTQLIAEQDENTHHKPLSPIEAASLYRELKQLVAEDAARRQAATQFTTSGQQGSSHGAAESAAPHTSTGAGAAAGDSRAQAARMVTGHRSYTKLEQINTLREVADDPDADPVVRDAARAELKQIEDGSPVNPAYQRIRSLTALTGLDQLATDPTQPAGVRQDAAREATHLRDHADDQRADELRRLAEDALHRVRRQPAGARRPRRPATEPDASSAPVRYGLRAFLLTWNDLDDWWTHYDPTEIGTTLTNDQWERFEHTLTATINFADTARTARHERRHS